MAQATSKRTRASKPAASTRPSADRRTAVIDRTVDVSDEVLKSVEAGERAALNAVRKLAETVDRTLPPYGKHPTKRHEIMDSAIDRADRFVDTQHDFLRKLIDATAKSAGRREDGKTAVAEESDKATVA